MKRLTIYTAKYEGELRDFAAKSAAAGHIIKWGPERGAGRLFALTCTQAESDGLLDALMALLMDIAEEENPVYKHSSRLRKVARELRRSPLYERELGRLRAFLRGNREINLEGYVTFRMGEFRDKLDMMIYSLVKKIKFSKGD